MAKLALVVRLVAKSGKEEEVAKFLAGALPLANAEAFTSVWFALRTAPNTFYIVDAFADEAGQRAPRRRHREGAHGQCRGAPRGAAVDREGGRDRREDPGLAARRNEVGHRPDP